MTESTPPASRPSFIYAGIDLFLILSFVLPFALYMLTLAPSVTFFDSGEFITAINALGSAHSPGYPLYLMYAKLFTWLPVGNIAFRVNMATAFSSSLACLGVYLCAHRFMGRMMDDQGNKLSTLSIKWVALGAATLFAATARLWLQSNHDKPYPLLSFMVLIIFMFLQSWRDHYQNGSERPAYVYGATFLAGLATGLHQTIVLFVPAWFLFIVFTDRMMLTRFKEMLLAVTFSLVGFSINLYLPLRATQNPILNWGDPKSLDQFLWHFLRRGYPSDPHPRDGALWLAQIKAFNLPREFTWIGVVLLLIALVVLWRRQREFVIAWLVSVVMFIAVIAGYFNTPFDLIFLTEEFFTPLYALSTVILACGLYYVIGLLLARLPQIKLLHVGVILVMSLSLPTFLCATNYYENDQHDNYIAFDYATNSLRSLQEHAVLYTWGDSGAFPLWYLQWVERMREDVDIPHTPHLVFNWYLDSLPKVFANSGLRRMNLDTLPPDAILGTTILEQISHRPVYIDFSTRYSMQLNELVPIQNGLVYRVKPVSDSVRMPVFSVWGDYNNRGIIDKISFIDLDTGKAILIYANAYLEAAEYLLGRGEMQKGAFMLDLAQKVSPEMRQPVRQLAQRYGIGG